MRIFTPKHGFIRLTRQYVGGIVGGFGMGAITINGFARSYGAQVVETPLLLLGDFLLIAVGGSLALSEQRRLDTERNEETLIHSGRALGDATHHFKEPS